MSWTDSPSKRNQSLPADWQTRRRRVLKRDNNQCQLRLAVCTGLATTVDHIINIGDPSGLGTHEDNNLQSACQPCHQVKTNEEAAAARRRHLALGRRTPEAHPGLIP